MSRYFVTAHYMTAGGNHGSTCFNIVAGDLDSATERAIAKVSTRGRRKIVVHVYAR